MIIIIIYKEIFILKENLIVKPVREKAKSWIKSFQIFFATRFYYTEVNKAERTHDVVFLNTYEEVGTYYLVSNGVPT
jgi:hypothetical protein